MATSIGFVHRHSTVRSVGSAGQLKRWSVVWAAKRHFGQTFKIPGLKVERKLLRWDECPSLSWASRHLALLGSCVSVLFTFGAGLPVTGLGFLFWIILLTCLV